MGYKYRMVSVLVTGHDATIFCDIRRIFSLLIALNLNRGTIFSATILTVGFEYEQVKQLKILMRNAWV